ncbi:hypothetical protein Golax_010762, partial [Gossypium laxum]|nr:hypothetical protein [Gossypium laxum]
VVLIVLEENLSCSAWFGCQEEVSFVALRKCVILVKFNAIDDRTRNPNLSPWLFDQCLFTLLPFVKDQGQMAIIVGEAIGEALAIDWRDRDGGWIEYIRVRVKLDVSKPFRRVVHLVGREETEI